MWTNRGMRGDGRAGCRGAFCGIARGTGILLVGIVAAAGGCGTPAAPAAAVRLDLVDHDGLLEAVARQRGRVVVLDCWSTSCPPCVKEFPRLVDLAGRYGDDVVCLSLSFDYEGIGSPEDVVPRVRTFLEAVGAGRVVNLLGREEADSLAKKLDIVSVPVVYVYGPDGGLVRRFDEDDAAKRLGRPFNYDDVEAAVRGAIGR